METATIRISKDLLNQLKILADENFRSVPKTIEWLLHEYRNRTESAQEYCETEPMKSLIVSAMNESGEQATLEELFK